MLEVDGIEKNFELDLGREKMGGDEG